MCFLCPQLTFLFKFSSVSYASAAAKINLICESIFHLFSSSYCWLFIVEKNVFSMKVFFYGKTSLKLVLLKQFFVVNRWKCDVKNLCLSFNQCWNWLKFIFVFYIDEWIFIVTFLLILRRIENKFWKEGIL